MNSSYTLDIKTLSERRYNIFVFIWAISSIFHMAHSLIFTNDLDHTLLTLSIAFLIAKPSSVVRFLIFLIFQLSVTFRYMPNVVNHEILYVFANITIIQALVFQSIKYKTFNIDKQKLYESFAPAIRWEVIIFYFYVVFHKLNSDFFDPIVSCGTIFYKAENYFNILPESDTFFLTNAYLTVFIEALIPLLLCFKKTRNWGLFIGIIFHTLISYNRINRFFDITAAIFAAYVLFMDFDFSNMWYKHYEKLKQFIADFTSKSFTLTKFLLVSGGFIFFGIIFSKLLESHTWYKVWTAFCLLFIYMFVKSLQENEFETRPGFFRITHYSLYIIPILVFFNGLCPYLGLKTEYSFTMFANLKTEGGVTNHYLVPVSTQIFDYQKDVVEIISSSDSRINKLAKHNDLVTFFSLNALVHQLKPSRLEYLRNGKYHIYEKNNLAGQGELSKPNPYILGKLLKFRTFKKESPIPCTH